MRKPHLAAMTDQALHDYKTRVLAELTAVYAELALRWGYRGGEDVLESGTREDGNVPRLFMPDEVFGPQ